MKILISDFDNTLFTKKIQTNKKLIDDFRKNKNVFIIATGRPIYLLLPELSKYSINYDYLICNDGAVIFDNNNEIIYKENIDYQTTIEVFNILKRSDKIKHVYIDGITDFKELDAVDYNGILATPYDFNDVDDIIIKINKKYPTIHGYLSHKWLNFLSISSSKGNAIKYLQNKEAWQDNDIYVIGDNINDLSMTIYENSYAVSISKKEFIEACNYRVKDFEELINKLK